MRRFGLVFVNVLVALALSVWFYYAFFRVTKTYHLEAIRTRVITYGTPEREVHIQIPQSVASRKDFVRFCEPLLRDGDRWKRAVASKYLARTITQGDPLYPSVQQGIWDLCSTGAATDETKLLIDSFRLVADDNYTGRIVSKLVSEPDRHVRESLLYCLGKIRSEKSSAFLRVVALTSSDPDDARAAAANIGSGSSREEIETVEKYLERRDAKKECIAGPSVPEQLQSMKRRLLYRRASLGIAVLFPILVYLVYAGLRKKHAQPVRIGKLTMAEATLLACYFGTVAHSALTAIGGGDTGAFSPSYRATVNCVFICFLMGLYVINIFCCQKYIACIQAMRQRSAEHQSAKASILFGVFFLNLALILEYLGRQVLYAV